MEIRPFIKVRARPALTSATAAPAGSSASTMRNPARSICQVGGQPADFREEPVRTGSTHPRCCAATRPATRLRSAPPAATTEMGAGRPSANRYKIVKTDERHISVSSVALPLGKPFFQECRNPLLGIGCTAFSVIKQVARS